MEVQDSSLGWPLRRQDGYSQNSVLVAAEPPLHPPLVGCTGQVVGGRSQHHGSLQLHRTHWAEEGAPSSSVVVCHPQVVYPPVEIPLPEGPARRSESSMGRAGRTESHMVDTWGMEGSRTQTSAREVHLAAPSTAWEAEDKRDW